MRNGIWLAALTLSACSAGQGGNGEVAPETAEPSTPVSSMAADGKPPAGFYRAVDETGFVLIEELREDGTYLFADADGNLIEEGTYVQKTPQLPCFTSNADGAIEKCYLDEIGEDGIWRTTDPDTGVVSVIERMDPD